jgi:HEAT repeat protein
MPRETEEEQAEFLKALQAVADEGPLAQSEVDALSMLEGSELEQFRDVWSKLPAPARARLIRGLQGAAEQRLRLDFSTLTRLALDDSDARVRLAGIHAAIEDRSPALLGKLVELLRGDRHAEIRRAAAEDLARFALLAELEDMDGDSAVGLRTRLLEVIGDENEELGVRGAALAALGYFSDVSTAEELARGFATPGLRLGAIRGMGRSADPRWTDRLMPVLGSDDPDMRAEAARALGEIEDERALTPLVEVLDDPTTDVRLAVIEALGHIGGEEAREALLYLAEDADDTVRAATEKALEEIEDAEADPMEL